MSRAGQRAARRRRGAAARALVTGACLAACLPAAGLELSGHLGIEARGFAHAPAFAGQRHDGVSAFAAPEFYHAWDDGRQRVVLAPWLRVDGADPGRTGFDLREALYHRVGERFDLRAGIGRVFWGVAESRHLVDVVNQSDLAENVDGEDKLGQPMLALTLHPAYGSLDVFVLPGFRARRFPGPRGRLRGEPWVDGARAGYESGAGRRHVDLAARWSVVLGAFDLALSHFHGTSREPRLLAARDGAGRAVLVPRYDIVDQSALELQATRGAWLWKLEALHRAGQGPAHVAWVGGFEHTLFGLGGGSADLGLLVEHLFDGRGAHAPQPFANDLFVGLRLAANDAQGSELLAGVIHDLDGAGEVFSLEASRRLGERWRVELEARLWSGIAARDRQRPLARDDYLALRVLRYF